MPTKKRLAKEREKKKRGEAFAVLPEHLVGADLSLNEIAESIDKNYFCNWVTYSADGETAYKDPHPEKKGNTVKTDKRRAEALRLKEKYPDQWGKRGGPKCIAIAEGMDMANDHPPRKIQEYFNDFP